MDFYRFSYDFLMGSGHSIANGAAEAKSTQ